MDKHMQQIGEMWVTVSPPGRSGLNEIKHSIVTYKKNQANVTDECVLYGQWIKQLPLTGQVSEIIELAEDTVDMVFSFITEQKVCLYWVDDDDVEYELYNPNQQTTFEFLIIVDEDQ